MQSASHFTRTDWTSFGAAAVLTEVVYLFTLNPDIGLRNDGYSATAALYGGVAMPAGFPLWSAWGWLFVKCLPLGSIGWRASVATSAAGALTAGIIALFVSRISANWLELIPDAMLVRALAGASAGINFGLNAALWRQAVVPDPWPMSNFLLCLTVAFFLRWTAQPEGRRYLYLAAFAYGLTLTNSQICLAIIPAIPFALCLFDFRLGRDTFLTAALVYVICVCHLIPGFWPALRLHHEIAVFNAFGLVFLITATIAAIRTHQLFSEWRLVLACLAAVTVGYAFILDLPLVGMTNPPGNWGYPRTPEGFFHVIARGQYDISQFSNSPLKFLSEIYWYFVNAWEDLGWPALVAASVPFCFWRRLDLAARKTLLALLTLCIFLALLMIAILQPTPDLQLTDLVRLYYTLTYLILSILSGFGLTLLAKFMIRSPHSIAGSAV